jgi:hypothetical protein
MLLIIALFAMLLVVAFFRKPGIPFFSIVSFSNRQNKLTAIGAKLYVVAAIMLVLGMLSSFVHPKPKNLPDAKMALNSGEGKLNGEEAIQAGSDSDRKMAEYAALTQQFSISAETLTSMMETNGMAESRLELCNSFMEGGMMDWRADQELHRLRIAVRDCHNIVINLCSEAGPEDAGSCSEYKARTASFDYR